MPAIRMFRKLVAKIRDKGDIFALLACER